MVRKTVQQTQAPQFEQIAKKEEAVGALLVTTALLVSAGVAQAVQLPCSTNPGPNCYNDLRPSDKLAACEHIRDVPSLRVLARENGRAALT